MKLGKKDTATIVNASVEKLKAIERAVERQLARRKMVYNKDNKSKMGQVQMEIYRRLLINKTKIVKDNKNVLYFKFKKQGMWSGNKYVYRDKLRFNHDKPWQSFILDYANRKRIKKLKPEVIKTNQWYGQR